MENVIYITSWVEINENDWTSTTDAPLAFRSKDAAISDINKLIKEKIDQLLEDKLATCTITKQDPNICSIYVEYGDGRKLRHLYYINRAYVKS